MGRGVVVFGIVVILAFMLIAIFAPLFAPYDPYDNDVGNALAPPSQAHLLGTDAVGRDILSRVLYGSRTSLLIGLSVVAISTSVGIILGVTAGYLGGWVQTIIMRRDRCLHGLSHDNSGAGGSLCVGRRYKKCDYRLECGHDAGVRPLDVRPGADDQRK